MDIEQITELLNKNHEQILKDLDKLHNIDQTSEAITSSAVMSKPLDDEMIQKNRKFRREIISDFDAEETYDTLNKLAEEGVIRLNNKYMESLKARFS